MQREEKILSPVTGKGECKLIEGIDTNIIIEGYRQDLNVDVTRFFTGSNLSLYACPTTGYRFFHPPSSMGDGPFYEQLEAQCKGSYYPQAKWEYSEALKYVSDGSSILEIGCGNGAFYRLCNKKNIKQFTGLELNDKAVKELQQQKVDVHNKLVEDFAKEGHKFNVVCSFQVLEHVYCVHSFLLASVKCLEKDGLLIIGVPNSNPYMFKNDVYNILNTPPHHIGLWNKDTLEKTADFFGLDVVYIKVAPFEEYKNWFLYHRKRLINKNAIYKLLKLIPRPLYKLGVRAFASQIEGSTILAVFKKR